MCKRLFLAVAIACTLALPILADSNQKDDIERINNSARVFHEIMSTPDKGIPEELLESAKCVAIIPAEKKFALVAGGDYGKGLVTCRTAQGWSAPLFLAIGGGSVGLQIGGSSTDIVMVFRNRRGLDSLLSDKFKIGADATAAAGPVGRHADAATDHSGNEAMYGANARPQDIVNGSVKVPKAAQALVSEVARYARAAKQTS